MQRGILSAISTRSRVLVNGGTRTRQWAVPENLFLPMSVVAGTDKFPLVTEESFQSIRKLGDCKDVDGRKVCQTDFPAEKSEIDCLRAVLSNQTSSGNCHVIETIISSEPPVVVSQGITGILISASDSFSIFGRKQGKVERIFLASKHSKRRFCVFVPAKYEEVTIKNATYEEKSSKKLV